MNYEDEQKLPAEQAKGIKQPTLFIQALKDNVLTPELSKGSKCDVKCQLGQYTATFANHVLPSVSKSIPDLTSAEVPASHWALWHTPQETNDIIKRWFEGVVLGGKSKL